MYQRRQEELWWTEEAHLALELNLLFICVGSIPFRKTGLALTVLDQDE